MISIPPIRRASAGAAALLLACATAARAEGPSTDPAAAEREYRIARRLAADGSGEAAAALARVVALDPTGLVVADPGTGRTGNPKVYVGGDALSGGELVVTAAQEGKRAARAIATALGLKIRVDAPLHAGHP